MVWSAGEAVQEQVPFTAAKLHPGSTAVWMGMYAPVIEIRAIGEAGPLVVVEHRATVGVSAWAIVMRSTAGMRGASGARPGSRASLDAEQAFCYCWHMFAIPAGVAA